jgi:hypothetical protein
MFLPKKKGDVFFPARKAADERWRWGVVARSEDGGEKVITIYQLRIVRN